MEVSKFQINIGSGKNRGFEEVLGQKNVESKNIFKQNICSEKKFRSEKNIGSEKEFWIRKNFWV